MFWQTSRRKLSLDKTLVMAILNVTPDSFSDGGKYFSIDLAIKKAEALITDGANILDVGGESTRPNSRRISVNEECERVVPVIEAINKRFDIPISIDTSKSDVAANAVQSGAEIINDVSGLRFDERIADVAAISKTGLILMHLRGDFETMHRQTPVENILSEVAEGFQKSIETAKKYHVKDANIALDVGIGFSKMLEQNLELIAKLNLLRRRFPDFPILVGASRKSFLGKILNDAPVQERLFGSLASASIAAWNGANIVRVHDVRQTVETLKVVDRIKGEL